MRGTDVAARSRAGARRKTALCALLLMAACAVGAGCVRSRGNDLPPAFNGAGGNGGSGTMRDGAPGEKAQESQLVAVPDVTGLAVDEAEEALRQAGLEPQARDVHGPVEQEASGTGPGVVYKQVPAAGEKVAPGTKVEISSWWESQ